ncbi:MAG: GAF and ANTAR domain-containing protein [Acidimicrobiales bacterium]
MTRRERLVATTLLELAEALVADFDVVDLLGLLARRCVELLSISAAGVVLADEAGYRRVMACSTEQAWLVELLQAQNDQGPCLDCYRGAAPVSADDLGRARGRWPRFAPLALDAGVRAAHALPLRLRGSVLGALGLFANEPRALPGDDALLGRALADMAAISLVHHHAAHDPRGLPVLLEAALHSRSVIEQSQGMLAERHQIDLDEAFTLLRRHSQEHDQRLAATARAIVERLAPARRPVLARPTGLPERPGGPRW